MFQRIFCNQHAYNHTMFNAMLTSVGTQLNCAVMARLTLMLNHVISSESTAVARLVPHAGRSIRLDASGWPSLMPALPVMIFIITPAGLLQWCGPTMAPPLADLKISLDVSNPAGLASRWLIGQRPTIGIEGDADFAADVNWLIEHLRWDIEDDLAQIIGATAAHQWVKVGRWAASGFTQAVRALHALTTRRDRVMPS
jgi:ubiquinone biosynthesis accessory factor UbiJ